MTHSSIPERGRNRLRDGLICEKNMRKHVKAEADTEKDLVLKRESKILAFKMSILFSRLLEIAYYYYHVFINSLSCMPVRVEFCNRF